MSLEQVFEVMEDLQEDTTVSKNIRNKISLMQSELKDCRQDRLSLTINKILSDLEDLSSDVNIPPFVRTQFWHISSLLESWED